jgi:acyl dehydratase
VAHEAPIPSGFQETEFGGEGLASIERNRILLEPGVPLAGVTWTGAPPVPPYALEVEFTKRFGNDFPCALTFPVAGAHLSLVLGGWGGTVCGLSSLDGLDASRNETRFLRSFPPGARTHVRVEVSEDAVRVALDGVELVRVEVAGRTLGLRAEVLASRPLGIAAFATAVEVHSIRWGPLGTTVARGSTL